MNIIIFGGAGFIGTNLTIRLLKEGYSIISVDNFFTGNDQNINQFLDNPNYHFCNMDITNKSTYVLIDSEIKNWFGNKLDRIYNLACPASPPKYQIDPIYTIHCSLAIEDIAKLALKYDAQLLHSSTSEVYGDPDDNHHPQTEEYRGNVNCFGPRACYDEGKRIAETILYEYVKLGLRVKIVRIFNTYGPYMDPDDGRVISNLVCEALKNEDLTIYGDGMQTRSFQYVDDLLDGFEAFLRTDDNFIGPCNIGSPYEFTIKNLAELILSDIPESKSKIVYEDLPVDDPTQRKADTTRIFNKTGWKTKTTLEIGLKKTIQYFKSV